MIKALFRFVALAVAGAGLAWAVDRWLGGRGRPDDGEAAPDPVRSTIEIGVPIERVWIRLAELERQPEWMHDLKWVELLTPGPIRVGTRAAGLVRIAGIGVNDPIVVTEFLPPHDYAIRHEGAFKGSGVFRLEALDDGRTRVTWDETLIPPILPNLIGVIQAPLLGRIFQADLERLRDQLEIEAVTTPA
jgi:uncharacterized protein YndB with AHSA1/START domain